jgi:hypothetical protein
MAAHRLAVSAVTLALVCASGASAQEPAASPGERATTQEQAPEGGSGFVAKLRRLAEEKQIVERLNGEIDGWYPRFGGITRGSGLALGPGFRTHLFGDRLFVDLSGALSVRGYRSGDARVRWVSAFDDRVELWTDFRAEEFPQEDFFGPGYSSSRDARTSYDFSSRDLTVLGRVRPVPWLSGGVGVGYMRPRVGPGTDDRYPSIEQLFTDAQAPGLDGQPNFLHTTLFTEIDTRDEPGHPKIGGVYRVSFGIWDDRTLQQYDHRRFDALARHYLPLSADRKHVLSGRVGLAYVNNETGERVPFYFLAYVGGVDTIRSYHEFRFKDENAIWLGAEYQWTVLDYLSVAAFADAGEVRSDWEQIGLGGLRKGYGFGLRAHTRKQTLARLDFGAGGGEGWAIFLKVGPQ